MGTARFVLTEDYCPFLSLGRRNNKRTHPGTATPDINWTGMISQENDQPLRTLGGNAEA